jgi:hypothetical protein
LSLEDRAVPLIRVIYHSEPSRSASIDMKSLHDECLRNNTHDNIGGFLHYNGYHFMQVLEGEQAKVIACYQRIANDKRHTNLKLVAAQFVDVLQYHEWKIGLEGGRQFPAKEVFLENFAASIIDPTVLGHS